MKNILILIFSLFGLNAAAMDCPKSFDFKFSGFNFTLENLNSYEKKRIIDNVIKLKEKNSLQDLAILSNQNHFSCFYKTNNVTDLKVKIEGDGSHFNPFVAIFSYGDIRFYSPLSTIGKEKISLEGQNGTEIYYAPENSRVEISIGWIAWQKIR